MSSFYDFLGCLPAPAFQAVVDCLSGPDTASLRLVSTALRDRTTHSTRSIVLRLSGPAAAGSKSTDSSNSSTPDSPQQQQQQLRSWVRATKPFNHVPAVHIQVSGALSAQQWGAALRVLALRGNVRILHIAAAVPQARTAGHSVSVSCTSTTTASIPSLQPVRQLLPGLAGLSVTGVTVTSMADDVAHFLAAPEAEAAGFRDLRSLNLSCGWSPSGALKHAAAFTAAMQALPTTFPALTHLTLQLPALAAPLAGRHHIAPNPAALNHAGATDAAVAAAAAAARAAAAAARVSAAAEHAHMQAGMLAAAVAAAAALPKLQALNLARVPDVWAGSGPAAGGEGSVSAVPAAAFRSLDALGSWLLQQLPDLAVLRIDPVGATCCMRWDRSRAVRHSNSTAGAVPAPLIQLTYHAAMQPAAAAAAAAGSASRQQLLSELTSQLSRYTKRPADHTLPHITSLQAAIRPDQLPGVAAALTAMPALQHLKLTVLATSSCPTDFAALVAAAAAAAAGSKGGLRSLTLLPGLGRVEVSATALLPLLDRCGSSSLRELKLVGNFATATNSSSSGERGSAAAAAAAASPWAVLRQMQGLEVLRVHHLGPEALALPVECLPAGLRVWEAKRVQLLAHSGSSSNSLLPVLEALTLQDCRVATTALASLASSRLQQLCVAATELPGGWAAAVAAWPHLKGLTLWCPAVKASSSSTSKGSREPAGHSTAAESSARLLQDLTGFRQLQGLELQHLPQLNPEVLQAVLHHMPHLSHLALSAASTSAALQQRFACSSGITSSSRLRHVSLRLPAALPRAAAAQLSAGGGAGSSGDGVVGGSGALASSSNPRTHAAAIQPGAVQQGLLAALPWCGVGVAADVCAGYPRC